MAAHVNPARAELLVRTADMTADLESLIGWARRNQVDLTGLQVGPPSLEEAYLALTGESNGLPVVEGVTAHA
jgi:ABC-2 type transport system ATP-binding protein